MKTVIWLSTIGIIAIIIMMIAVIIENFKMQHLYWLGGLFCYCLAIAGICLLIEIVTNFCIIIFKLMNDLFTDIM